MQARRTEKKADNAIEKTANIYARECSLIFLDFFNVHYSRVSLIWMPKIVHNKEARS